MKNNVVHIRNKLNYITGIHSYVLEKSKITIYFIKQWNTRSMKHSIRTLHSLSLYGISCNSRYQSSKDWQWPKTVAVKLTLSQSCTWLMFWSHMSVDTHLEIYCVSKKVVSYKPTSTQKHSTDFLCLRCIQISLLIRILFSICVDKIWHVMISDSLKFQYLCNCIS